MAAKTLKRYGKIFLKIAVSGLALWLVFRKIEAEAILNALNTANLFWVLPALLLYAASKVLSSFRLNLFLRKTGIHLSEKTNLKLYWLGMFYNISLPGGIGGDGYKIFLLNRETGVPAKKLFWTLLLERINGLLMLVCLAIVFAYFTAIPEIWLYFIWAGIPAGIFVYNYTIHRYFPDFSSIVWKTNAQSLLVQLMQVVALIFLLLAFGVQSQYPEYLVVFLISSVAAMFPFTIGGAGARELTFLYGAALLGLNAEIAVTASLLFYIITLAVSLPGVYYSLDKIDLEKKV